MSKRLGRCVGKINAIFQTTEKIRIVRRGKDEAKMACDFLKDFTPEQLIMLGMMADATDERYMLAAFCDNGDMDLSLQVEEISIFVENCT